MGIVVERIGVIPALVELKVSQGNTLTNGEKECSRKNMTGEAVFILRNRVVAET